MNPTLRLITRDDINNLRVWKNNNKKAFFHQKEITKERQEIWYDNYIIRNFYKEDFMYIVNYNDIDVGCVGYRFIKGNIDVYNVILGDDQFKGHKIIAKAMKQLMKCVEETHRNVNITAKVITGNDKAIKWYLSNGWIDINTFDDYILMKWKGNNNETEI